MTHREPEIEYLRRIERLAHSVANEAALEGWLAFGDEGDAADAPLHRAVNELATHLRMTHYLGDGCVEHD
jgi:hypothetical protein